jgi:hypothetical protein
MFKKFDFQGEKLMKGFKRKKFFMNNLDLGKENEMIQNFVSFTYSL